jgi:hypothetical protein
LCYSTVDILKAFNTLTTNLKECKLKSLFEYELIQFSRTNNQFLILELYDKR